MKEILLFTLSSSVDETVQDLGKLGVVDIKEVLPVAGEELERRKMDVHCCEQAIAILEKNVVEKQNENGRLKYNSKDPARIVDRILISVNYRKQVLDKLSKLEEEEKWYEDWGFNIDLKEVDYLRQKGIEVKLYLLEKGSLNALSEEHNMMVFPERDDKIPVALFTTTDSSILDGEEVSFPKTSFTEVKRQIVRKKRQLDQIDFYLYDQAENIALLNDYRKLLLDRLNTRVALDGMGDIEGRIKYIRGFIPKSELDLFKNMAEEKQWGYQISEPEITEEIPVLIKNPKWVSIINPLLKFIDIIPGYKEVDVSIYFLIAFALFFAMLVGDAGYGAIFLLATLIFRKKLSRQVQGLIYVLSGSTILWGVFSGTYFGSERIAEIPFFNELIIPQIASFGFDNISFMMHLSFLIGAIHLTIAHSVRIFQLINSTRALSEIGWIAFTWGLFFVAEKLVLGKTLPDWNIWLFVAGALLVTLFSKEGKTFISSIFTSVANLPLSLINGFSDIVSYVRLFAVGMATATVASSFNTMILPAGVDRSFLDLLMAAIALLLGHGLNIVLALMAVMVHGIRLNMLEFAGHLGVQFSGEVYQPFKLNSTPNETVANGG